jgi:cysteine desulfurase
MQLIQLDHHASTPCAAEAVAAMEPFLSEIPFNAHSAHGGGAIAARAVARARTSVADLIGASPDEIVFTSGATEANNIALLGLARAELENGGRRRRILFSAIEHKCVIEAAAYLGRSGFVAEALPVGRDGILAPATLADRIDDDVLLVSVMAANNEIGTVQPIAELSAIAHRRGALLHSDLAQMAGKLPFEVLDAGCDLASLSAHKLYGPKGVGALFVAASASMRPRPIMFGGGQEEGLRPGTLPVAAIVGFGAAADLCARRLQADSGRLRMLAAEFLARLAALGIRFAQNGDPVRRLPGSLNLRFAGADAVAILDRIGDHLLLSAGSACSAGARRSSHVLRAIGLSPEEAAASLRIGFGRGNDIAQAMVAADLIADALASTASTAPAR